MTKRNRLEKIARKLTNIIKKAQSNRQVNRQTFPKLTPEQQRAWLMLPPQERLRIAGSHPNDPDGIIAELEARMEQMRQAGVLPPARQQAPPVQQQRPAQPPPAQQPPAQQQPAQPLPPAQPPPAPKGIPPDFWKDFLDKLKPLKR